MSYSIIYFQVFILESLNWSSLLRNSIYLHLKGFYWMYCCIFDIFFLTVSRCNDHYHDIGPPHKQLHPGILKSSNWFKFNINKNESIEISNNVSKLNTKLFKKSIKIIVQRALAKMSYSIMYFQVFILKFLNWSSLLRNSINLHLKGFYWMYRCIFGIFFLSALQCNDHYHDIAPQHKQLYLGIWESSNWFKFNINRNQSIGISNNVSKLKTKLFKIHQNYSSKSSC